MDAALQRMLSGLRRACACACAGAYTGLAWPGLQLLRAAEAEIEGLLPTMATSAPELHTMLTTTTPAMAVSALAALGVLQTTCTSIQLIQAAVVGLFGTAADKERAETEGLQGGAGAAMDALLLVHLGTSKGSAIPEGLQLAVRAASRDL